MAIKFITGNKNKFEEVQSILGLPIEQLDIELSEIQTIRAEEIVIHKLKAAEEYAKDDYIVEDTSLYLDCLNGELPGPLIKWFEKTIGNKGIVQLAEKLADDKAVAKTLFGYAERTGQSHIFEGELRGRIVPARGGKNFGWDPIFQPEGYERTFGEMTGEEKRLISMRSLALEKLRKYLEARSRN